jgi:hypothetical protein
MSIGLLSGAGNARTSRSIAFAMNRFDIGAQRERNQHIGANLFTTPSEVVSHLCAIQAQDFLGALWAIGVRLRNATERMVEKALEERRIIRTWPLRGTLHFVAAEDARWMLDLLAPGVISRNASRLEREHGVNEPVLKRSRAAIRRALAGGGALTRSAIYEVLDKARISTAGGRGLQIVWQLAHEGLICFGPRQGKQQTFVLLDDWLPASAHMPRDEALPKLARRYVTGHGPATIADFVWWSGLPVSDAKKALELARPDLAHEQNYWFAPPADAHPSQAVHLLPPFDEFTVAYKNREDVLDPHFARRVNNGGGMLQAVVTVAGRVVGTWKRTLRPDSVVITMALFRRLTKKETRALDEACDRYAEFLGVKIKSVSQV